MNNAGLSPSSAPVRNNQISWINELNNLDKDLYVTNMMHTKY